MNTGQKLMAKKTSKKNGGNSVREKTGLEVELNEGGLVASKHTGPV